MPGLIRGVARTAVIAGTATHVSNNVSRRQGQRWAEKEQAAAAQQQQAAPPPPPQVVYAQAPAPAPAPASGLNSDSIEQLKQLAALKEQGILTEAEFAAEKAKILGS
jgi:hypothetical protein